MSVRPTARRIAGVAVVFCLAASLACAEDDKPNPAYTSWAKCKPGATTVIKGSTEAMGNKSAQTITTKLVEVTPEKAVVEVTMSMEVMGQKMDQPSQKQDIPKTFKMPVLPPGPDGKAMKIPEPTKGTDTVTVAGKEFMCETAEVSMEMSGIKTTSKTWSSTDVPGGMVKMESHATGKMQSTTTMELVEFKDGN